MGCSVLVHLGRNTKAYLKNKKTKAKRAGGHGLNGRDLANKNRVLNSNPSTAQKKN
jgi:hypothetical protein